MNPNRVTLLNKVNPQPDVPVRSHTFCPESGKRTYAADAKCTGGVAKAATVDFYGTNIDNPSLVDEYDWTKIGTVALNTDGTHRISSGFVSDDTWNRVKAVISAADAGDATLTVNAHISTGKGNA